MTLLDKNGGRWAVRKHVESNEDDENFYGADTISLV